MTSPALELTNMETIRIKIGQDVREMKIDRSYNAVGLLIQGKNIHGTKDLYELGYTKEQVENNRVFVYLLDDKDVQCLSFELR